MMLPTTEHTRQKIVTAPSTICPVIFVICLLGRVSQTSEQNLILGVMDRFFASGGDAVVSRTHG